MTESHLMTKNDPILSRLPRPSAHVWLVIGLSFLAWSPLLTPAYFFKAHDARHSIFYVVEFTQTLQDGYLWPRWSPDFAFGYGYPLFNIYAPLAIYAASLLHLMGLNITTAVKTIYALATIGGGLGMYGFTRRLFGGQSGLLAATIYTYAPFHFVDIYVRSAYAEFVALAIVPYLFWAFTELIAAPSLPRLALAGLSYGLLALTHHTSFFTFTPFLMIYILYLIITKTSQVLKTYEVSEELALTKTSQVLKTCEVSEELARPRANSETRGRVSLLKHSWLTLLNHGLYALGAGSLGVALASIYLIPVLAETKYIKIEQWTSGSYSYLDHFVYFSQFFLPSWGYGYAGIGLLDDFSYQLGIVVIILNIFALVNLTPRPSPIEGEGSITKLPPNGKGENINKLPLPLERVGVRAHWGTALFFALSTLGLLLLMSPLALDVWQITPLATLVQFPWRLLGVTAFTMSIVAGSLVATRPSDDTLTIAPSQLYLLLLIMILSSYPYTMPQYTDIPDWAETPLAVIHWDKGSSNGDRIGMVAATQQQPTTSPMEAQYLNHEPLQVAAIITGTGQINTLHHGGSSSRVHVVSNKAVTVQFYTYDYPGWQVTINNEIIPHRAEPPFGLITVDVPPGEHDLYLFMGNTLPRTIGTVISGAALLFILGLLLPRIKKSNE